jgi:hypothetical protein
VDLTTIGYCHVELGSAARTNFHFIVIIIIVVVISITGERGSVVG